MINTDYYREKNKGFFVSETTEEITLNFWGGEQTYNKKTKTYKMLRSSGIFSNMTVAIYAIFVLTISGYPVEKVEFIMIDYFRDRDIYDLVFEPKVGLLDLSQMSEQELNHFLQRNHPNNLGLNFIHGTSKNNFNFQITNKIIERYFTLNNTVISKYESLLKEKNIEKNKYIFIWARKTDKVYEIKVPSCKEYLNRIEPFLTDNTKVILQTDDRTMIEDFDNSNFNYITFGKNPVAKGESFHQRISLTDDKDFIEDYGMTKDEYFIYMFCVLLAAKDSSLSVIYPGNPSTIVPIYKGTFDDCILYINEKDII
jgi:hypothetical protein